jgi:hypothetical protein
MARFRLVMMQRNSPLIEAWFRYHGYLVGFENLTVFDNGSTDPAVVAALRRYQRAGSTILWQHRTDDDFVNRAAHFGNVVAQWAREGSFDAAMLVESDDFVALFDRDGLSCGRDAIADHAAVLAGREQRFEIGLALRRAPSGLLVGRESAVAVVTAPLRDGAVAGEGVERSTELTCVGLGETSPKRRKDGAPPPLVEVGFPAFSALARMLVLGVGYSIGVACGDGVPIRLLRRGRALAPAAFQGSAYLELNPDVMAAGWPPLKHFIMHGARERRRFS